MSSASNDNSNYNLENGRIAETAWDSIKKRNNPQELLNSLWKAECACFRSCPEQWIEGFKTAGIKTCIVGIEDSRKQKSWVIIRHYKEIKL